MINKKVTFKATGRAYKQQGGRVISVNGDTLTIAPAGREYRTITRKISEVSF